MRRTSHQHGSLKLADRRKGKVWEFRWREVQIDGSVCRKNIVVGTLEEFPTESAAQSAVDAIRLTINRQTPQQLLKNVSVEALVKHYQARTAGHFFKPEAGSWKLGRASQVLRHAVCLRHLLEKVGSSALAVIPSFRGESGGCRSVVENNAVGTWEPGQNQESDERLVFSCDPMGVDRTKPDQERKSDCEAHENARCPDTRRDYGTAQRTARTSSNGGRTGRLHRFATWRTDRLAMGGCGLREPRNPCSPFSRDDGPGRSQDGSFRKGCTARRCSSRVSAQPDAGWSVQSRNRLGVCLAHDERQTTALARNPVAAIRTTCSEDGEDPKVGWVPHLPSHVHNSAHSEQRGSEGGTGAPTPCEQSHYARSLRSGGYAKQAAGTKQTCSDGAQQGRSIGLTGPNWTMTQIANSLQVLERNGGDDGTRTRGLCLDRNAVTRN